MKRKSILIVVLILVFLMTTGAVLHLTAGRTPAVKAKTEGLLKRGGVLIEGLLPGCGKDAILAAGIDLEDKPGVVAELSKDEVVSEIYNADQSNSSILLDGGKISEARFQFYGDRLISIVLETQNQQSALQSFQNDAIASSIAHGAATSNAWLGEIQAAVSSFWTDKDADAFHQALVTAAENFR